MLQAGKRMTQTLKKSTPTHDADPRRCRSRAVSLLGGTSFRSSHAAERQAMLFDEMNQRHAKSLFARRPRCCAMVFGAVAGMLLGIVSCRPAGRVVADVYMFKVRGWEVVATWTDREYAAMFARYVFFGFVIVGAILGLKFARLFHRK